VAVVSIISAMSDNRVIGRGGDLPWRMPVDLKFFKAKTLHHCLIMGRKTFETPGHPLPDRRSIVITRDKHYAHDRAEVVHSLEEALQRTADESGEVFIGGGAQIYRLALPIADRLYLTVIHTTVEDGDTFFPEFDESDWDLAEAVPHAADEKNPFDCTFKTYERKKSMTTAPGGGLAGEA